MKEIKRKNIFYKGIIAVVCSILIATSFSTAINQQVEISTETIENQTTNTNILEELTYTLNVQEPILREMEIYETKYSRIELSGSFLIGETPGKPVFQVIPIKLLIPQGTEVKTVDVIAETYEVDTELQGVDLKATPIIPHQKPVPIGEKPSAFIIDESAYSSNQLYPEQNFENLGVGYCRGYAILTVNLYPIQYIPADGKLFYKKDISINIELEETGHVNQFYNPKNLDDRAWVGSLVENPIIIDTYDNSIMATTLYDGGLCDHADNGGLGYDYVILVKEALYDFTGTAYNWDDLINKKEAMGLEATKVKVEDILACTDYENPNPLFNDEPARIREFCKDAYQDWNTRYILIAGDNDNTHGATKITRREMDSTAEYNVDSDVYWTHLDLTFNADEDSLWGEEGDTGFDLYSEIYSGSIPCDDGTDVSNWLTKSFLYEDSWAKDYLENAAFYGGNTGWDCQGDDFVDYSAIKGTNDWLGPRPHYDGPYPGWLGFQFGFETWNSENPGLEYDLSVKWTAEPPNPGGWMGGTETQAINGLRDAISNDQCTLISAIAHANEHMSMDVYDTSWESSYHNTMPFFLHDYGCHCGDMDATDDGVLHSMLFHSDVELAFACVYNTGYGWGNLDGTNSSSALQQKSFWDYLFDTTNNSGSTLNWQLGKAQEWSRDLMAPTINWGGSWREIIQCCLLFGDPALTIKPPVVAEYNLRVEPIVVPTHVPALETVDVSTTIINNGMNDISDVTVNFIVNGTVLDSQYIPLFEMQTTEVVNFAWTPDQGWYIVTINVTTTIPEDVYSDNEKSDIVIAGPDIVAGSIDLKDHCAIGYTVDVEGTVENLGPTDENINVYLIANGITEDSQEIYLESGTSGDVSFIWEPTTPGTYPVEIQLETIGSTEPYTDNNQIGKDTHVFIAKGNILIVDDDKRKNYEPYYEISLLASEYLSETWNVRNQGHPSVSTLQDYDAVVWFTGNDHTTTLEEEDQNNLMEYLDNGGKLFLTGQDIGTDIGATTFYVGYLKTIWMTHDTNESKLDGIDGDPIGDGLHIDIATGDGANNQYFPDGVKPIPPATRIFNYEDTAYGGGTKIDTGIYKAVYFSFGFEGINNLYDRNEIMTRVMTWLDGPRLAQSSTNHNFGTMYEGETDSTTFEIWNSRIDTLEYTLSETCDWVTVTPTSGESTGEHDTITVEIATTGCPEGINTCDISITSNGGISTFTVTVDIDISEKTFVRGDLDGGTKGEVSMADALYILNHLYVPGAPEPGCMDAADVDDNGVIETADALFILKFLYVPASQDPPEPYPICGTDPTPDILECECHTCFCNP